MAYKARMLCPILTNIESMDGSPGQAGGEGMLPQARMKETVNKQCPVSSYYRPTRRLEKNTK
jgi:hypothetical protein